MKNIIVIEQNNSFQFDSIEDLIKGLLDDNYYNMSEIQKKEILKKKAFLNKINNKELSIVEIKDLANNINLDNKILISNEYTYILSLASSNIIILLERKDADIFFEGWDKAKFAGEYIIVNKYSKALIKKYISKMEEMQ